MIVLDGGSGRARAAIVAVLVLGLGAIGGCAPAPRGLLDLCDGEDGDGDGIVDEGIGAAAGCDDGEQCVGAMCDPICGDGACISGESCSTCPADCGACPACGDASCNGTESCGTCPGDCGACPACGDGRCNGAETCSSCRADCGLCPGECASCETGSCGSGLTCLARLCDGAPGCYGSGDGATCPAIGGQSCPRVSAYDRCTSDADCGPRMRCTSGSWGSSARCAPSPIECDTQTCPGVPPSVSSATAGCACINTSGEGCSHGPCCWDQCWLSCTGSCPYGLRCVSGTCVD